MTTPAPSWWPSNAPEYHTDDDGHRRAWSDTVPPDGSYGDDDAPPYTYYELIGDRAEAAGMSADEYFNSLRYP